MRIDPFLVEVPDDVLADLRARLARTRFPATLEDSGWDYGTDLDYLRRLVEYWRDGYDWRAQESALNRLPHFRVEIEGRATHFVHSVSPHPGALPLLMTHGWPGSFYEFHKVLGPLTDPPAYGGDARDAFTVVCPSIPGYGWSQPAARRGFGVREVAASGVEVMRRLGYSRFGVQGGDWGASISATTAQLQPEAVVGVHLNMVGFLPESADPGAGTPLSAQEAADVAEMRVHRAEGSAYRLQQATRPQTLSFALSDSPAGLAAWIVEKFRAWSDCDGDVESVFTRDELLTNIMIYWVSNSVDSAARLYRESRHPGWTGRVDTPVGCAILPRELSRYPRSWVDPYLNVVRWTRFPRGGHFAALEVPELLVEDIRAFFRELR